MLDMRFLESFTRGDKTKMKRYIQMYLDISPGIFQQMKTALDGKNWESLRINAHSLKPQADYMGVPKLKECLVRIEEGVVERKYSNLSNLYDEACKLHLESTKFLKNHIETF